MKVFGVFEFVYKDGIFQARNLVEPLFLTPIPATQLALACARQQGEGKFLPFEATIPENASGVYYQVGAIPVSFGVNFLC